MGCASISKEECLVADWYAMGLTDGSQGRSLSTFRNYQADCAKHQLSSDFTQYQSGHEQGILSYCVYTNGVTLGKQGGAFNPLCEDEGFASFQDGYFQGQQLHQVEGKLAKLRQDIDGIQSQINQAQQSLEDNQAIIIDDNSSKAQRQQLLKENDRVRRDIRRLQAELRHLLRLEQSSEQERSDYLNSLQR